MSRHLGFFEREKREQLVMRRLSERGIDTSRVADGDTDFNIRRDRIGELILGSQLADARIGSHKGQPETFAAAFSRFYGIELQQKPVTQE